MAGTAHIYIDGEVGPDWYGMGEGVTLSAVRKQLEAYDRPDSITVHIDSPGGVVSDGLAIHDFLTTRGLPVTTIGEGRVYSIATVILLAGDKGKRYMTKNASFMVHNPWGGMYGTADEMEEYAQELRRIEAQLAGIYREKTGQDEDKIKEWMSRDTYFSADEAIEIGFADAIYQGEPVEARQHKLRAVALLRAPQFSPQKPESGMSNQTDGVSLANSLLSTISALLKPKAEVVEAAPVVVETPAPVDEKQKTIDELTQKLQAIEAEKADAEKKLQEATSATEATNKLLAQIEAKLKQLDETPLASTKAEPPKAAAPVAPESPFDNLAADLREKFNKR